MWQQTCLFALHAWHWWVVLETVPCFMLEPHALLVACTVLGPCLPELRDLSWDAVSNLCLAHWRRP